MTSCRNIMVHTAQLHLPPDSARILVEDAAAMVLTLQIKVLFSRIPPCLQGGHCSDASQGGAAMWHSKAMQGILTSVKAPKVSIQTNIFCGKQCAKSCLRGYESRQILPLLYAD